MSSTRSPFAAGVVILLCLHLSPAHAFLYIDEDFEGTAPFVNRDWPIRDNTTIPTAESIRNSQGINIRAYSDSMEKLSGSIPLRNTGSLTADIAFSGRQSLRLASGRAVSIEGASAYPGSGQKWFRVIQFALTVDPATLSLPAATRVARFQTHWSTDLNKATVEATWQLNLTRNALGGIDLVVDSTGEKVGEIPAAGKWVVVTMLASVRIGGQPEPWKAWDPFTGQYKGPQPTGDPINDNGICATIPDGISVHVNSNTAAAHIPGATLSPDWGRDFEPDNPDGGDDHTDLTDWGLLAENGGTLYVDDLFWAHGVFHSHEGRMPMMLDAAARIGDFTGSAPPSVGSPNGAVAATGSGSAANAAASTTPPPTPQPPAQTLLWYPDIPAAQKAAIASGKRILVFFHTPNQPDSVHFINTIFADPTVQAALAKGYACVGVDCAKDPQTAYALKIYRAGVVGIYTVQGVALRIIEGGKTPSEFLAALKGL